MPKKTKQSKTTRTAAQIAASITANAQAYKEGEISEAERDAQAAADWSAARTPRLKAEVTRLLREDYRANDMGEPLAPHEPMVIGRDGKEYPAVLRFEPWAAGWRVQNHPELPTFAFKDMIAGWASYWHPRSRVEFVERASKPTMLPECAHCALPITDHPVTFSSPGKPPVHYHERHAQHRRS